MSRIALATSQKWIELPESDRILADALRRRGHEVSALLWGAATDADAVVIRSCWDYHLQVDRFLSWVDSLTMPVINAPSILRWNARKTYLFDLERSGIKVVPTRHVVDEVVTPQGKVVVKPVTGASAYETRIITDSVLVKDSLVQPFVEEIISGEWSLIVFDGVFAHAVLKHPREGDFRVQTDWGGRATLTEAPVALRELAARIVATITPVPAYARVDMVVTSRGPLLMELELIEPELFLNLAPESASSFCDAIERRLR